MAKRHSDELVLAIIEDLEAGILMNKEIAPKYGVSLGFVESINGCRARTNLHQYSKNIRGEAKAAREGRNYIHNVINEIEVKEDYCELRIVTTKGIEATSLFSIEDLPLVQSKKWTLKKDSTGWRVRENKENSFKYLHQYIVVAEEGCVVDHINRNPLDNRRENLRSASYSLNSTNAKARTESPTGIRGVYRRKERPGIAKAAWVCEWSINGKRKSTSFSVAKYGEEEAFQLAKTLREEKMNEMKI